MNDTVVIVNKSKCSPTTCGNYLCMRFCPRNKAGDECIIVDADKKVAVNEEVCIACNICVNKCPFKALSVVNTPKELKTSPVHQYNKNGFRLYGLPIPKKGLSIGLLGANGIGKSTALQVLAGDLRLNLGDYDKKASDEDILKFFIGTETMQFMKDKFNAKHKTAYKPQYVEAIPKAYNGSVRDLLKKINKDYEKTVSELDITRILDTDIKNISGGELQRVAIAASLLKNANNYFFDEPSSYLDIKQRLKISSIINGLKNDETNLFIVEHDLIMMDFMTDLVHIFYGSNGAYGVTSYPYTSREGINAYLKGYLANENMKFRDKPIIYDLKGDEKSAKRDLLNSWDGMKKKLGNFTLTVNPGALYEGEVTGIVGANGIGKTTFARIIAGELEPDSGLIDRKVKISYKPQYIKADSEMKVRELILTNPLYESYKHYFRHLEIESLMNKQLNQLSGGELQRVMIVNCLTKDADIYLLDEPSAHLDVEQRIQVAKSLKDITMTRKKNALVIDHDLMFIDYVAERLLVFKGTPAVNGEAIGPMSMRAGMNLFLKDLNITFRRDETSHRPRPNKESSVKDREQKSKGEYYYS
ncbi:MAG TPA: ribosome biogenesis/translation initiation ATPase RLI [Candidatus Nanoarchaeia archaeon]|nr:ribosome biogenesis/translation initiation ATPase RLI [Candidatus Nanoarchaeia archaeon]